MPSPLAAALCAKRRSRDDAATALFAVKAEARQAIEYTSPTARSVVVDALSGSCRVAETHNRTLTPLPSLPNFGRWFIFANDRF